MADLLLNIWNSIYTFLNNENYIETLSIIVVAITSYHIAKFNASKPNKLKIKQLQLTNVYLPLYRIFSEIPDDLPLSKALSIHNKTSNILDKNYELVFPQLHKLNSELKQCILSQDSYNSKIKIMKHQIEIDYELLKRTLGYPSENFLGIYKHMTFKQKAEFIISWCNVLWIIAPAIIIYIWQRHFPDSFNLTGFWIVFFIIMFVELRINRWVKNLKD